MPATVVAAAGMVAGKVDGVGPEGAKVDSITRIVTPGGLMIEAELSDTRSTFVRPIDGSPASSPVSVGYHDRAVRIRALVPRSVAVGDQPPVRNLSVQSAGDLVEHLIDVGVIAARIVGDECPQLLALCFE